MRRYGITFWHSAPFVRLLIPAVAGIVLAEYTGLAFGWPCITGIISLLFVLLLQLLPVFRKYQWRWVTGILLNFLFVCLGAALVPLQNMIHHSSWIGHHLQNTRQVMLTLQEPISVKPNSYKTLAKAELVNSKHGWKTVKGNILLYFKKTDIPPPLSYGSQLIIYKPLQPITNSGNPGAFDYKTYCARQDIHYQVFLQPGDYRILQAKQKNRFTEVLIHTRYAVLSVLRKWIPGEIEYGVAEALLIGYRDDLDKDLVRAYSNTGVVHIIAISGLHLGMIYGLLLGLLKPFRKQRWIRWGRPLIILSVLWGFSLLAGAAASILRSVVMFSFIAIGKSLGRRTNIYNTLAASAFCLLVVNPYFLWDVGFQLSYTAVLGIVIFMKPVYHLFYFSNKLLQALWQLNAITLAAQPLTLPIVLYYFHQFPNLFLFTNFISVPLSGFILYGEIFLLLVHPLPYLNTLTGQLVSWLIGLLNHLIEQTSRLPFAVTDNISFGFLQVFLLYGAVTGLAVWLLGKRTTGLLAGLGCLAGLLLAEAVTDILHKQQHKLIVYNIPRLQAIDILEGSACMFLGDPSLKGNTSLAQYHLRPARILYGVSENRQLMHTRVTGKLIAGKRKIVLVINKPFSGALPAKKIPVDIIILSGNPRLYLNQLASRFTCTQYIFDSSIPLWKIRHWKKDADNLHLRHHTISEQGAFEVDL